MSRPMELIALPGCQAIPARLRHGSPRRLRIPIGHFDWSPGRVAKPIASGRGNAEDLRSRSIVGDRFLLDRIDVSGNHTSVDVEPQLALVHSANAAQTNLALADLAVAGARRAHDFVRALDRLPELGDFPHRSARWLTDIEDFLL